MEELSEKQDRLSALEKALVILEIVTDQPQPIGLPDLNARTGMPRQTLHRLLKQLEAERLILRDPKRARYSVGPRLARLSLNTLLSSNNSAPVRSVLQTLVASIQETCNLGVLDGMEFLYLERIESNWTLRVSLQAGSRVPAYGSAGGKILLALLPEDLRRRLITAAPLRAHTPNTITDPDKLEAHLAAIREAGYAKNDQEATVGIVGLAVPVVDGAGKPIAALAVHAPAARVSLDDLVAHIGKMRDASREIAKLWED